jgi:hypothetical protein
MSKSRKNETVQLYGRVLTASAPAHLVFDPESVYIRLCRRHIRLDSRSAGDLFVSYRLGATEKLQLGVDTNNFGLGLDISNGNIEEEYHGKYVDLFSHPVEFATNLHKNSAAYCGCPPLEMAVDYNLPDYSRSG